ncbi:hypothetical protein ACJ73_03692 [Blastomyces percursus]|uniref:Uncharacterized protein n=1 Tax=Blastomyces percursus TaxID=1658174 RepID=A0A1J9Q8T3_9EURO|nr:hypothetical protein ACJ73_03692 [Blastomyces percursus]
MTDKIVSTATVHLSVPGDWKLWYKHVQGYAMSYKVSDFVDLDKPDMFSELEPPLEPECPEDATEEAEGSYNMKFSQWKSRDAKYKK